MLFYSTAALARHRGRSFLTASPVTNIGANSPDRGTEDQ